MLGDQARARARVRRRAVGARSARADSGRVARRLRLAAARRAPACWRCSPKRTRRRRGAGDRLARAGAGSTARAKDRDDLNTQEKRSWLRAAPLRCARRRADQRAGLRDGAAGQGAGLTPPLGGERAPARRAVRQRRRAAARRTGDDVLGAPITAPSPPRRTAYAVEKTFFTLDGKPVPTWRSVKQNDRDHRAC